MLVYCRITIVLHIGLPILREGTYLTLLSTMLGVDKGDLPYCRHPINKVGIVRYNRSVERTILPEVGR